jgi:hypothetical protein
MLRIIKKLFSKKETKEKYNPKAIFPCVYDVSTGFSYYMMLGNKYPDCLTKCKIKEKEYYCIRCGYYLESKKGSVLEFLTGNVKVVTCDLLCQIADNGDAVFKDAETGDVLMIVDRMTNLFNGVIFNFQSVDKVKNNLYKFKNCLLKK